jgi:hypothetical protein
LKWRHQSLQAVANGPQTKKKCTFLLISPEFKPIGGDGDGVMERKEEARWARLVAANESLVARAASDEGKSHYYYP